MAITTDRPTKRELNDWMRDTLSYADQAAFFCECADPTCFKPVWLTSSDYETARADPSTLLLGDHAMAPASPA